MTQVYTLTSMTISSNCEPCTYMHGVFTTSKAAAEVANKALRMQKQVWDNPTAFISLHVAGKVKEVTLVGFVKGQEIKKIYRLEAVEMNA